MTMTPAFLRSLLLATSAVLGLCAILKAQVPTTIWSGGVSSDWNNAANWTQGVPNADKHATLCPATHPCVVSATGSPVTCRDLTVAPGSTFTIAENARVDVAGNLDLGASALGTGTIALIQPYATPNRSILFRSSASAHTLDFSRCFPWSGSVTLTARDVTCRGDLLADTQLGVSLYGRTEVTGTLSNRPGGGVASVFCEPTGTLIAGTIRIQDYFSPPSNMQVGRIYIPYSSSFGPQAGVIVFPSGTTTTIVGQGGQIGPMHILPGATVRFEGSGFGPSGDGGLYGVLCDGALIIEPNVDRLVISDLTVNGSVRFRGPNTLQFGSGTHRLQGTTQIQQGGSVIFEPMAATAVLAGTGPQVAGLLELAAPTALNTTGIINVGPTGLLRLSAHSGIQPLLNAAEVQLQGELHAADCEMQFTGPGGLRLLPGSHLTSLIRTALTSTSTDPNAVLLDVSRTEPTLLSSLTFGSTSGSNPPKGVRASSPYPVQISSSGGPLAGAAFEDDPLGVISWSNGVTYAGAATPGCLGLAECETTGDARLGNASFAFRCRRAHPSGAAIFLLGWGSASTPYPFANLNLWFDPALPLSSVFRTADATGTVVSPQPLPANPAFAGLTFTGQFVLFEPPGCTPTNLSASTAARIVLQP